MFVSTRQDRQIADFVFQGMQARASASGRNRSSCVQTEWGRDTSSASPRLVRFVLGKLFEEWVYRRHGQSRHPTTPEIAGTLIEERS